MDEKIMNFYYRWRLNKKLKRIEERKDFLVLFHTTSFYKKFGYIPDWNFDHEIANDTELDILYREVELLLNSYTKHLKMIGVDN